ncbi:hypothetical protein LJ656_21730 [Paraburkholderia sp. MMS20-SJTR3]|uniref:Uncharacterized protein n=1 Tax=Paraburkholderia sejongensis TaxID=2886946 RepID=A0ABS8JZ74_9BURK|nr:hypothetical protein [Paraburkholderia sp. MMS20-SJTR3]MCC8395212.1 hypothetical protein [Paraburkholderia sp. MMS20-SJTR3]
MATDLDDIELRRSTAQSPDFDTDLHGSRTTRPAPPRFGRLAVGIAAATALTFGVIGTVAYSVWFNHDQQTYADAIASARAALGSSTAGQVRAATPPAVAAAPYNPPDRLADNTAGPAATTAYSLATNPAPADTPNGLDLYPPSPLGPPAANAANAANAVTPAVAPPQRPGNARPAKDARLAQERRAAPSNAKHSTNLFARVGQFLHRASYRQQHSGRQEQDIYSHP